MEWETSEVLKLERDQIPVFKCSLRSWGVTWEFFFSGGSDMDRWGQEQRRHQIGLFADHYLHSLLSGDWTGTSASCLISVGGYHYFCDLFHSICLFLFLVQSSFPGAQDGDVNIFLSGEIKLSPEFYWWVSVICFSEIKSLPTHYKTGNFNSLRVTGVYWLWVSNEDVLQICLGLLCATAL